MIAPMCLARAYASIHLAWSEGTVRMVWTLITLADVGQESSSLTVTALKEVKL